MSALPAVSRQRQAPTAPRSHIEVVASRAQKRARPRAIYALVAIAGLFAILAAQLLLSIVVSEGAYEISNLQQVQEELSRDKQVVAEELHVLESPQHLVASAEALGMVGNSSMAYLRLADGAVLGAPVAAHSSGTIQSGPNGAPLVPNQLLDGVPITTVGSVSSAPAAFGAHPGVSPEGTVLGAPETAPGVGSVASTGESLPSPITR